MTKRIFVSKILVLLVLMALVGSCGYLAYRQWAPEWQKAIQQQAEQPNPFLTQPKDVFDPVLPGSPVKLPQDFAFHEGYQHEWWHYFANVEDRKGNPYGIQWTVIRVASDDSERSGWQSPQLYIVQTVITGQGKIWREQRFARGGIGQAGMLSQPFRLWIDNWSWRSLGTTPFPGSLAIDTDTFSISLANVAKGPFVLPGERGYQVKHELMPLASYAIMAPFVQVKGTLTLGNGSPFNVKGTAWLSKEWGNNLLNTDRSGWDWFVVNLDEETILSVNRFRHQNQAPQLSATLMRNDGKVVVLEESQIKMRALQPLDSIDGKSLPLQWQITIPSQHINLTTSALNIGDWQPFAVSYWQGPVRAIGSHKAKGFMQLSGY
ncbi:lipocalin-like domain-containing protein [Vibrio proteolyticus]